MRRVSSLLVALGICLGITVGFPSIAAAHDVLEKTTPADGALVDRLPGTVVLTFSEPPLAIGAQVIVTGPSGNVSSGTPALNGRDVTQALLPTAPGGDYTVSYRVTSDDGHPVSGSFSFHATVGLDGSTATAGPSIHVSQANGSDEAQSSPFVPVLLTILGTTVLLVIGGYVVLRSREADRS